jgi:2-methylcitrate dehydratase PrpD
MFPTASDGNTVMAIAEMRMLSGAQALTSYVAGFEVGARVARAAGITHFESGWQVTGTAGHLASAAAGARASGRSTAATPRRCSGDGPPWTASQRPDGRTRHDGKGHGHRGEARPAVRHLPGTATRHFCASAVGDQEVARLRAMVRVLPDDTVGKRGAHLRITLRDGSILDHLVRANRGTPENPLSDADLDAKLRSIAVPRLGVHGANELLAECWDCDLAARASDVLRPFRHPD